MTASKKRSSFSGKIRKRRIAFICVKFCATKHKQQECRLSRSCSNLIRLASTTDCAGRATYIFLSPKVLSVLHQGLFPLLPASKSCRRTRLHLQDTPFNNCYL